MRKGKGTEKQGESFLIEGEGKEKRRKLKQTWNIYKTRKKLEKAGS